MTKIVRLNAEWFGATIVQIYRNDEPKGQKQVMVSINRTGINGTDITGCCWLMDATIKGPRQEIITQLAFFLERGDQ